MIIDKGKLIALLVDKTGQPKAEIEPQLNQLKKRIRSVAESGGIFEIEGFGTFTKKSGALGFEPSQQLQTEINQKYAGMKPIELMEPFKETGAEIPIKEETEEGSVSPKPGKPEEEKMPKEPAVRPEEPEQPQSVEEEEPPQKAPEKEEEPELVAAVPNKDEPSEIEKKSTPQPEEETTEEEKADQPKPTYRTPAFAERHNNKWSTIFFTAIIVIGLLAAGWAMYDAGMLGGTEAGNGNGQFQDTPRVTAVPPSLSAPVDSADTANAGEQNSADTVSSNSSAQTGPASTVYGLKGRVTDEGRDGYTIIIHSFRLRSTVQEIADSLDQQNYRTLLLDDTVGGESRWRLGIGQFGSIEDAQKVVQQLPDRVQRNYFITRIE